MAPVLQITPRKDGKTQEQAQADMAAHLAQYYTTEEYDKHSFDEDDPSNTRVAPAQVGTSQTKAKRPPRKEAVTPKGVSASHKKGDGVQSSPLTRKSARVASKRAAVQASGSDTGDDQDQQLAKTTAASSA